MTKDEALRLALEALESTGENNGYHGVTQYFDETMVDQAITAIKAALEAKDEPVAWRDAAIRLGEELSSVGPDGYYDMDAKEWLDWAMEQNPRGEHSLPQRTWVGLTDDEYLEAESVVWVTINLDCDEKEANREFYQAIEAKLKEKNT